MKMVLKSIVLIAIWIIGFAIADYVFVIETNPIAMLWGYIIGAVASGIYDLIER